MKPFAFSRVAHALAALGICATLAPAWADQQLLPAQSSLGFVSKQMGVPVEGQFRRFSAQLAFDPAQLAKSQINFTVDVTSATLGVREADAELPKPVWFNSTKFPQATFQSAAIKALGGGRYEVAGKLSIKGIAADVVVPVMLTQSGSITWASGTFPIKRLTYKVGENEWADTSMVADEVQVKFKLALSGVGKL